MWRWGRATMTRCSAFDVNLRSSVLHEMACMWTQSSLRVAGGSPQLLYVAGVLMNNVNFSSITQVLRPCVVHTLHFLVRKLVRVLSHVLMLMSSF